MADDLERITNSHNRDASLTDGKPTMRSDAHLNGNENITGQVRRETGKE